MTNVVNIAADLAGSDVEAILTGGTLRKNSFSLVGPIAEEMLRYLHADTLFLAVDGFDVHYGLSTPNLLEAKVNRIMVEMAKRTVAVCDSSKFGRRSLSHIAPLPTAKFRKKIYVLCALAGRSEVGLKYSSIDTTPLSSSDVRSCQRLP